MRIVIGRKDKRTDENGYVCMYAREKTKGKRMEEKRGEARTSPFSSSSRRK